MYFTDRKFITAEMNIGELIFENPSLLLLLEHFGLGFMVHDKTICCLCEENNVSLKVFLAFANLYQGFHLSPNEEFSDEDIPDIMTYLKNSHHYYENEKYPEIINYIREMYKQNNSPEIKLIDKFFNEYFEEVKEHLLYENRIVFPYFQALLKCKKSKQPECGNYDFSVEEYRNHHTDIEFKLDDLKNLLLKHVPIQRDAVLRRKIIMSLFELEYDLSIHSAIEETVLVPLIDKLEKLN